MKQRNPDVITNLCVWSNASVESMNVNTVQHTMRSNFHVRDQQLSQNLKITIFAHTQAQVQAEVQKFPHFSVQVDTMTSLLGRVLVSCVATNPSRHHVISPQVMSMRKVMGTADGCFAGIQEGADGGNTSQWLTFVF